jgi:hypothetical protein
MAVRDTLLAVGIRPRAGRPSGARTVRPSSGNRLSKSYCIAAVSPRTPAGLFPGSRNFTRVNSIHLNTYVKAPRRENCGPAHVRSRGGRPKPCARKDLWLRKEIHNYRQIIQESSPAAGGGGRSAAENSPQVLAAYRLENPMPALIANLSHVNAPFGPVPMERCLATTRTAFSPSFSPNVAAAPCSGQASVPPTQGRGGTTRFGVRGLVTAFFDDRWRHRSALANRKRRQVARTPRLSNAHHGPRAAADKQVARHMAFERLD